MVYADYRFYQESYLGSELGGEEFPRLALRASGYLDYITQGRAAEQAGSEAVKMACCALAEEFKGLEYAERAARRRLEAGAEADQAELESESVGDWARRFRSGGESAAAYGGAAEESRRRLREAALRYLAGTGLLYRGRGQRGCGCFPIR